MNDLRYLSVESFFVMQIPAEFFEGKTELEYVRIRNADIADLTPFARMERLEELNLTWVPIDDVTPLAGLDLTSLTLEGAGISDLSPFAARADMPQLEEGPGYQRLDLSDNNITDVAPLGLLQEFGFLNLLSNPVDDISPLVDVKMDFLRVNSPDLSCEEWTAFIEARTDDDEDLRHSRCP